jgi:hypothetical protein
MTIRYVNPAGSNTSPYDTWAKGATALLTVTALMIAGDVTYVANTLNQTGLSAASATYVVAAGCKIIGTADTTNMPPTSDAATEGTAGASIQTTTTNSVTVNGGEWWNIAFKGGSANNTANVVIGSADDTTTILNNCIIQITSTNLSSRTIIGPTTATASNSRVRTIGCSFVFASVSQGMTLRGDWEDRGSQFATGGSVPSTLFGTIGNPARVSIIGATLASTTLFAAGTAWYYAELANCVLAVGTVPLATLGGDNQGEVTLYDCDSGDIHYDFAHYNWRGNTVASVTYSMTDGPTYDGSNRYAWVVTGVNGTFGNPYWSPWIRTYNGTLAAAITPWIEAARDGSATKYNDDTVFGEFGVKATSGFVNVAFDSDRCGVLSTPAAQATGAGTGSWSGLSGTACSMKLDYGASVTPQEIGDIMGRVGVVGANVLIVDPQIRS